MHLAESMEKLAQQMKVSETELRGRLEAIRKELWAEREHRVHPGKDDKVLADWNGLMIAALAKGSGVLDEPEYAQQAGRAVYFILQNMVNGQGHLLHRYRDGQAAVAANLDDYAFLVWGLLELYEATFEVDYLRKALELNGDLLKHFWDEQNGGFYFTADYAEELLVRRKESYDGAVPSGNSAAMLNLLRLERISAQPELEAKAARVGEVFSEMVRQMPSAHSLMLSAADFAVGPSFEVVIAGDSQGADTREMFRLLGRAFVPNKVVVLRNMAEKSPAIVELAKYCVSQTAIDGKATAYVCRNYRCELPTTDPGKMMKLLQAK